MRALLLWTCMLLALKLAVVRPWDHLDDRPERAVSNEPTKETETPLEGFDSQTTTSKRLNAKLTEELDGVSVTQESDVYSDPTELSLETSEPAPTDSSEETSHTVRGKVSQTTPTTRGDNLRLTEGQQTELQQQARPTGYAFRNLLSAAPDDTTASDDIDRSGVTVNPRYILLDGHEVPSPAQTRTVRNAEEILKEKRKMYLLLHKRILSKMNMSRDIESSELEAWCSSYFSGCTSEDIEARVTEFFFDTNNSVCYDDVLQKRLCSSYSAIIGAPWRVPGIPAETVAREMGRRLHKFKTGNVEMTCLSGSIHPPTQFVAYQKVDPIKTSGPTVQNHDSMHCLNLLHANKRNSKLAILHVLMPSIPIALESCSAVVNLQQCIYGYSSDGVIPIPLVKGAEGRSMQVGSYTLVFNMSDVRNKGCSMKTLCVIKGREIRAGLSEIRGFETTIRLYKQVGGSRRLMGGGNQASDCLSGTHIDLNTAVSVHGSQNGGPGQKLTVCNGSVITDTHLGPEQGCYTINKIITGKPCKDAGENNTCTVAEELQTCDSGKCISLTQPGKGMIKLRRGKTSLIMECSKSCLIPVPTGSGDITIDCTGGRQHFLEVNIVDIHCPAKEKLKGLMLYFCRMSSRPVVALGLAIWLAAGYVITCLASFGIYQAIFLLSVCFKKIRQRRERLEDICIKCEQTCINQCDQELHDLNCSFNLCPYCSNRLSDEGLVKHVGKCPKRSERLEEIELYLNYKRVPCILRMLLSMSVQIGVPMKRLSWLTILIILFIVSISPVQGVPSDMTTIGFRTDYGSCYFLLGVVFASLLLVQVRRSHYGRLFHVVDGFAYCNHCETYVDSLMEEVAHECLCPHDCCPYCLKRNENNGAQFVHVRGCLNKETGKKLLKAAGRSYTNKLVSREGIFANRVQLFFRRSKALTLIGMCLILLVVMSHPSAAFDSGPVPKGIWEQEEELVKGCGQECYVDQSECLCPMGSNPGRKLLFLNSVQEGVRRLVSSHKLLTSVSIDAPWGAINVESTFKPTLAASNIDLSWNTVEERGDKISLSGRSTGIIKLQERTGLMWKMSSDKASEAKNLLISVMDYSQLYNPIFQYITGDRSLSEWPKAVCTGDCPERCGCTTSTCYFKSWPHTRNWRCNPTWCWGIGTGCTCCGMDVERYFNKFFAVKWNLEYVRTDVVVCVELTDEERHCDLVQAGSRFTIGPVTVTLSDPQNVATKLPENAMTVQEITETGILDIMHVSKVISADNACRLQSCSHGSPGDLQIIHTDNLIKGDLSTGLNLAHIDPLVNTSWMSWEGCDLDYYCNVGDWPSCTYTGVTSVNTDSFTNLLNVETDYTERFHFHSKRISAKDGTLQLDLKARPNTGGGEMTVLVEVNGLELHSKKIVLKGLRLRNLKCVGCFSCSTGLSCSVVAKINSPDEFHIHLRSTSRDVVCSDTSLIARKMDTGTSSRFRAFAVRDVESICFEVVEKEYCVGCEEADLKICTKVSLDPPKDILLEHKGTIIQHYNKTCGSGYECWVGSVSGFFIGVKDFFEKHFGGLLFGTIGTLLPIILTLIFFVYGRRIFCLCSGLVRCCRGRKGKYGYQQLDDSEGVREIIKKFSRGGELLGKGEKDKRTVARMFLDPKTSKKDIREVA